ncbi:MAG: hypothetical protein ACKOUM_13155 [Sphingopyxis sp.]
MMSLLDGIMNQLGGSGQIAELASKVGLSEEQVSQAMAALSKARGEEGDTVAGAAAATGLSTDSLSTLLQSVGGEGALGKLTGLLDRDGDGNPLNDVASIAGQLFNR